MQKNTGSFTFLFTRRSRSRIYFKRIELSEKLFRNSLFTAFFVFSILSVAGVASAVYTSGIVSQISDAVAPETTARAHAAAITSAQTIDYSRPAEANFAINSGGPFIITEQLSSEDAELERQLQVIQSTSDPSSIPSIWAHLGKINNEFGFRRNPFGGRTYEFHAGMDIDGERGDLVVAPATGVVTEAGWKGGYGQMVEIDHGNGLKTRYGHLSKIEVETGETVFRGQLMAYVGSTGRSTGPHLHYELRLNDRPINPRRFLPPEPTEVRKQG